METEKKDGRVIFHIEPRPWPHDRPMTLQEAIDWQQSESKRMLEETARFLVDHIEHVRRVEEAAARAVRNGASGHA